MIELDDHLIDITKDLVSEPLPELHKERRNIWRLLLISRKANEVLVIRVLCDLLDQFPVGIVELFLNPQGTQCHSKRFRRHSYMAGKEVCISIPISSHGINSTFLSQRFSEFILSPMG